MAAEKQIHVDLTFNADVSNAKKAMKSLIDDINKLSASALSNAPLGGFSSDLLKASQAADQLRQNLSSAFNVKTGNLDLVKFNASMKSAGMSLSQYQSSLMALGPAGAQSFAQLSMAIMRADAPLTRVNSKLQALGVSLKNTAKWQLSSSILHGFMGSISSAFSYAKNLNSALNDIRIVTGASADEMAKFASQANNAAKSLSTSTKTYADAALIFYQQGLGDAEVKERTDAVIKMANVTKDSAAEVSSYMTAIWNNFDDGSKSLEHYADVMTALGAATASSTAEIAAGLEKFASIGKTIGLSYDYATSALATIVSNTRQSAEVVGNGLRTIFSRLQGLSLGETLEDGVNLNKYSKALSAVGVSILDASGQMKSMDSILESLASKWETLSSAQQTALAQTVGGVRQYTTLISLMNNWDDMQTNLNTAGTSTGTLQEQADIYAESWEGARNRVKASAESIYSSLVNDDFFISLNNGFAGFLDQINNVIDGLGGLKGTLLSLAPIIASVFRGQINNGVRTMAMSLQALTPRGRQEQEKTRTDAVNNVAKMYESSSTQSGFAQASHYRQLAGLQNSFYQNKKYMSPEVQQRNQQAIQTYDDVYGGRVRGTSAAVDRAAQATSNNRVRNNAVINNAAKARVRQDDKAKQANNGNTTQPTPTADEYKAQTTQALNTLGSQAAASGFQRTAAQMISAKVKVDTTDVATAKKQILTLIETLKAAAAENGIDLKASGMLETLNKIESEAKQATDSLDGVRTAAAGLEGNSVAQEGAVIEAQASTDDEGNPQGFENIAEKNGMKSEEAKAMGDQTRTDMDAFGASIAENAGAMSDAKLAAEELKEQINGLGKTKVDFSSGFVAASSAIMAVGGAISSVQGLMNVWSDESSTLGDKLITTFTTVGSVALSMGTAFMGANGALLKGIPAAVATAMGYEKVGGSFVKAAAGSGVAGSSFLTTGIIGKLSGMMVQAGFAPITAIVLIIVAALAILIGTFAAISAVVGMVSDAYNADAIAAENAAEAARNLASAYGEVKEAYQSMVDSMDQYSSAREQLKILTEGTEEYADALATANEAGLDIINNNPEFKQGEDYRWENGELIIDETAMKRVKKEKATDVAEARAASLMADAKAAEAKAKAAQTELVRKDDAGNVWKNIGAGAVGGAALGAAGGLPGLLFGALGGAVTGLIQGLDHNSIANDAERERINSLVKDYQTLGEEAFDPERLRKLGFDTANQEYIDSLEEVVKATAAAADQTSNAARLAAEELLSLDDDYNKIQDEGHKNNVGAAGGRIYQNLEDKYYKEYLTDAGKRGDWLFNVASDESEQVFKEYAELMGLKDYDATDFIGRGDNGSVKYTYTDENGDKQEKTVTNTEMARRLAAAKAADEFGKSQESFMKTINKLEGSENKADKAISDFLGGDMTQSSRAEWQSLQSEYGFSDGMTDKEIGWLLDKQFGDGKDGKISDETAQKYGYKTAAEMTKAFKEEYNRTMEAWDDISLPKGMGEWGENLSLTAAQKLENIITDLNLGPLGESIGTEFVGGLDKMLEKVSEKDQDTVLNQLMNIDWSSWDAIEQADIILREFGEGLDLTDPYWQNFINHMRVASRAIPDFSKMKSELNGVAAVLGSLELGEAISEEDYQTLIDYNHAWADFFATQADGSRKFIGNAEEMSKALVDMAKDHQELLQTYSTAAEVTEIAGFDWDRDFIKLSDKSSQKDKTAQANQLDKAEQEFNDLREAHKAELDPVLQALGYLNEDGSIAVDWNSAEQVQALFDALAQAIDPTYLDQIDDEFKEMIASTATSLSELQTMLSSEAIDAEAYSKALIVMGSGYEYCTSAVEAYQQAIGTDGEDRAREALEAAIEVEEAASKLETAYSHAMSGKSSMTVEDLNALKESNEELYNSFLTMSDNDWYEAAYQAQRELLDQRIATHGEETAEYKAALIERQKLDEEYLETKKEKQKEVFDGFIENWESENKKIQTAVDALDIFSDGTTWGEQGFEAIETLRQALLDTGKTAEEVDAILKNLGKDEEMTDVETLWAATREKAKLLLEQAGNSQQAAAKLGVDASTELIITDAKSTTPKVTENESGDGFKANTTEANLPVNIQDDSGTKTSGAAVLWDANGAYVNVKDSNGKSIKVYIDDSGAVFDEGVIAPLGDGTYGVNWSAVANKDFIGSVGGKKLSSVGQIGLKKVNGQWVVVFGTANQTFTGTVGSSDSTGGKLFFDTADNKWKVQWGDGTTKDFTAYLKAAPGEENPFTTYFEEDPQGEGWVLKLKNTNGEEITLTLNADALNKDTLATSHPYLEMTDEGLMIKTKGGFLTLTPNIDFTNSNFGIDKDGNLTFNGAVLPLDENGAIDFSAFASDGGSVPEAIEATGIYQKYDPTGWEEFISWGSAKNVFDVIKDEYDGNFLDFLVANGGVSREDSEFTSLIDKARTTLLNPDGKDANEIAMAESVFDGMGRATVDKHWTDITWTEEDFVNEYGEHMADQFRPTREAFVKSTMRDLERITGYNFAKDIDEQQYGNGWVFDDQVPSYNFDENFNLQHMAQYGYDDFVTEYFDGMLAEILAFGDENSNEYMDALISMLLDTTTSTDPQIRQQGYYIAQGLLEAASKGLGEDSPILQALAKLISDMNQALGIESPSKVTMEMGKWLALGLQKGAVETDIDLSPMAEKALTSIKNYLAEHGKDLSLDEFITGMTEADFQTEYNNAKESGTTEASDIKTYAQEKGYEFNEETGQWQLTQESKKNYLAAYGANIQTTKDGKSYITNKDGKVISGLYDTIDEAILAGYQTLYSEEAMTKYFTGKIDNNDEFLSYMEDDALTAIQKGMMTSVIQGAVDAANKEGNLSTYVTSWEELIEAVGFDKAMEYLEASYGNTSVQFLNDIKSVWAEYGDLVVQSVQTHVGIEDKAAKEVVEIWKNAFAAILKAKQAMIDGESFASVLSEEEIKSFVELYAGSGKSAEDIRKEMFKTSGQALPEFNMSYNSADSRSFVDSLLTYDETTGYVTSDPLKTDKKTGEFIIPTNPNSGYQQFKTNLTNDVTSIIQAGMTDQTTGEMWDFNQLFESQDFQKALKDGNMDNAVTAAQALFPSITREVVELLAGTATEVKDEQGNVTSHKMAENVSVADFTQAYIDKTYPDLPQTYQDTVVGRITADIGQINTLKTNLTTQGDNFIKARQSEVDLVDKARGLLAANKSLAENLTLAEQKTLKELTGESDLAAISLGDLGTATTKLSGIMETASSDLEVAMGMLERGEATGFTINSDGTVSVSKSMSYATAAASGQTISEADKTAALAAAAAARKAAEDAYREANPLKEDASDEDRAAYNKAVANAGTAAYNETLDNFNVTVNITLNGEGVFVSDTVTNAGNATTTATAQAEETYATSAGFTDADEMNDYIAMMEAQGGNDDYSDGGMLTAKEIMDESSTDEIDTMEEAIALQREYAAQLKNMEEGLSELNESGEDWLKTLKDTNASISDQSKALGNLRKSYQKVLGLDDGEMEKLGDDFLTSAENLELVQTAAEEAGEEGLEALDKLQANAALSMILTADLGEGLDTIEEVTAAYGDLATQISELNFDAGEMIDFSSAPEAYNALSSMWNQIVADAMASGDSIESAMEQANSAISALGFTPAPLELEPVTGSLEDIQQMITKHSITTAYDADGNPFPVSDIETKAVPNGAGSYTIYVPKGVNSGGKGVPSAPSSFTANAQKTGGGGRRGGGGGGSRRRYLAKVKPEDHKERYHEIDNAIDDVTDALERLNKQQDRAWGADRLKSMKAESAELEKQADLIHKKILEAEDYLDTDLDAALEAGWTFDEDGNVSNYEEHWDDLLEDYNNAVEEYNNMSIAEQEAIDKKFEEANDKYYEAKAKGDTAGMEEWGEYINPETEVAFGSYEEYLKYHMLDAPTEALEQYEETMELLEDLGLEMADVLNSWYDNVLEQIQYKLDLALELTENELNIIDYKLKSIEDNAYRAGEALGLMTQKMDASKSNFNAYYTALDDLLKANNADWSADKLLSGEIGAKDLADAGLQSGDIDIIKTVMEGLRESTSAMTEQMVEGYETMTDSFESFNEELERYISTIEHAQNVTSTYKNILDLTGRSMSGFTSTMLKELNTLIVSQAQNKLTSSKTTLDTIKQEFQVAKDAYEQAQEDFANGKIDQAALDAAKDAYNSAQDTLNEAEENFLTSWEETLQAAADAFESNIEEITRTIGEALSGGLAGGLAELEDQFAKVKEQDEMYVDDYEKIYQLTKLTRDLESKIDNTTNVRAQKEMLKLQKEINGLLESDKELSQYDIEYLQKKADLKLAEIAMQDAQNAKSQVMMRRDSEGNYNYVYTADEDAVEKAEQEYADKLYEMQVANDEYITTLQENMSALSSQMLNEIASIDRTVYDTEEKYQAEVERITTHYSTMMGYYNSEMKKVLDNNTILYNEDWTEFNKFTGYKISAAENYVTKWNQTMLSQITGFDTQEDYYGNFNKTLFGDNPESPSSDSLIGQVLAAYSTMTQQIAAANEAAGLETGTLAGLVMGNIDAATDEAEAAAQNITTQAGLITTAIEGIGTAISTMAANYAEDFKTMSDATDVLNRRLSDFLTMAGSSQEFSIDAGVLSQIRARLDAEGFDTGGYTGAWGSEGKLAFLHQKELVLNAHDTANMLASVGILRQIANVIDLNALSSAGGFASLMQTGVHSNKETLQQEVHIEAHFPNATDKNQIEDAFKDIVNLAAQYANRSSF